ncbi:MAG: hypothetical protein ACKKL6_01710 [Candidatus Komeilibacteria bacterium]
MPKMFCEAIVDLIDTQITHGLSIVQVEALSNILKREKMTSSEKTKVLSLLEKLTENCSNEDIKKHLKDLIVKIGG